MISPAKSKTDSFLFSCPSLFGACACSLHKKKEPPRSKIEDMSMVVKKTRRFMVLAYQEERFIENNTSEDYNKGWLKYRIWRCVFLMRRLRNLYNHSKSRRLRRFCIRLSFWKHSATV